MMNHYRKYCLGILLITVLITSCTSVKHTAADSTQKPNIIFIYADDLGYGDVSAYGATKISTPNIDRIAAKGILFTNAYATAATCTPSRYSLMTGEYAWRKKGTGIAAGDAAMMYE